MEYKMLASIQFCQNDNDMFKSNICHHGDIVKFLVFASASCIRYYLRVSSAILLGIALKF